MSSDSQTQSSWPIKVNLGDKEPVQESMLSSDTVASFVHRIRNKHRINIERIRLYGVKLPYHWMADEVTSLLILLDRDNINLDEVVTAESTTMALPKANGTSCRRRSRSRSRSRSTARLKRS